VSQRNPHDLLGVKRDANAEEIHSAYKNRVKVLHPDRFNKETQPTEWQMANDMLRELNEAYAELKQPSEQVNTDLDASYEAERRTYFQDPDNPQPDELERWCLLQLEIEVARMQMQKAAEKQKWVDEKLKELYFPLKSGAALFLIGVAGMATMCWTIDPGTLPKGEWCWQKVVFWSDVSLMGIGLLFIYGFFHGSFRD